MSTKKRLRDKIHTKKITNKDENISSDESFEDNKKPEFRNEHDEETPAEKRLRMAQEILNKIKDAESSSDEENVQDVIAHRLSKEQVNKKKKKMG